MLNMVRADFYRMSRSTAMRVLLLITVLGAVAMMLFARQVAAGNISASISGLGILFSDVSVISILGGVSAGIFICGDLDNKVIHDAIAGGSSRLSILTGKLTSFLCTIVVFLIPYAIAAGIGLGTAKTYSLGSANAGFMSLLAALGGKNLTSAQGAQVFGLMLLFLLVYAAELSLCVPLALAVKKPVAVAAIYYAFSILCGQLIPLAQSSQTLDRVIACTPYSGRYLLPSLNMGTSTVIKAIMACVAFITVMLGIAYAIFRRADIK